MKPLPWIALCAVLLLACNFSTPGTTVTPLTPQNQTPPQTSTPLPLPGNSTPAPTTEQTPPAPATALPAGFFAKAPEESLEDFAHRILPAGATLLHPVLEGEFGPGSGNLVMLYTIPGAKPFFNGWVLVPSGNSYQKYELPVTDEIFPGDRVSIEAVFYDNGDEKPGYELMIMGVQIAGIKGQSEYANTNVYTWNGTGFQYLPEISHALWGFYPSVTARRQLDFMGFGQTVDTSTPAVPLIISDTVFFSTQPYNENNTEIKYSIETETPLLQGSDDPRVAHVNRLAAFFVEQQTASFIKFSKDYPSINSGSDMSYTLMIKAHQLAPVGWTVSILYYVMSYTGGAHPNHYIASLNYDLNQGHSLRLDQLFLPGSNYLEVISQYCRKELTAQGYLGAGFDKGADPTWGNYRVWAITSEGLMIQFNTYQVGPYVSGAPSVTIPYAELEDIADRQGPLGSFLP